MRNSFGNSFRLMSGLVAAAITGLAAVGSASGEPLRVKLEWLPGAIHAWYHLAAEKGWYKEAGLDVEIEDGKGSTVGIQLVGAGNFEIGGSISLAAAAIGRSKGIPVKAIAAMAQKSDMGFVFPKGKGWKTPKDLVDAGAQIIITPGDVWAPFLETIFKVSGSDMKKAQLLNVTATAKMSSYISADQNIAMTTVPPYTIPFMSKDRPSDFFMLYDIGLPLPGWGLIASDQALKSRPDEIRKFVKVTMRAFDHVIKGNETEGAAAVIKARPDAKLDSEVLVQQLKMYNPLFHSAAAKGKASGFMAPEEWSASLKIMVDVGLVPADLKAADVYSNDYVQ